jgi:hypothetical protein
MRWLVAVGAVAVVSGCSLGREATGPAVEGARTASPGVAVRCLDAGNLARGILAGARDGTPLTVVDAKAVRSPELDDTYLVAIRFGGHPGEETGVWASTSLDLGDDTVRSVDVSAVEVTSWPWSLVTDPEIAVDAPGVDAARACL